MAYCMNDFANEVIDVFAKGGKFWSEYKQAWTAIGKIGELTGSRRLKGADEVASLLEVIEQTLPSPAKLPRCKDSEDTPQRPVVSDKPTIDRPSGIRQDWPVIPTDPIVIDLNGDGIKFINLIKSKARFDIDNDGFRERVSWLDNSDGFLVRDLNNNGRVDNLSELIGTETQDGFDVLQSNDTNLDGVIDRDDAIFADLKVWNDRNGDGRCQKSELFELDQFNLQSISLKYTEVSLEFNDVFFSQSVKIPSWFAVVRGGFCVVFIKSAFKRIYYFR